MAASAASSSRRTCTVGGTWVTFSRRTLSRTHHISSRDRVEVGHAACRDRAGRRTRRAPCRRGSAGRSRSPSVTPGGLRCGHGAPRERLHELRRVCGPTVRNDNPYEPRAAPGGGRSCRRTISPCPADLAARLRRPPPVEASGGGGTRRAPGTTSACRRRRPSPGRPRCGRWPPTRCPGCAETDLAAGRHTHVARHPGRAGPGDGHPRRRRARRALLGRPPSGDGDLAAVMALVRRWLDLDHDPAPVDAHLAADPVLAPLVAARPGLRVVGSTDGWETAVTTVLGQQVSVAAARTFAGRLVAARPAADRPSRDRRRRRTAAAHLPVTRGGGRGRPGASWPPAVGLTGARARTVRALAEAVADGLALGPERRPADVRARLLAAARHRPVDRRVPGPAGARRPRRLPVERSGAAPGARRHHGPRAVEAVSQRWRPWRAYAVTHLWTAGGVRRVTTDRRGISRARAYGR